MLPSNHLTLLTIGALFWFTGTARAFAIRGRDPAESPRAGYLHDGGSEEGQAGIENDRRNTSRVIVQEDGDNAGEEQEIRRDDEMPDLDLDLYSKARNFGQSREERQKVENMLNRLDALMTSQLKRNGVNQGAWDTGNGELWTGGERRRDDAGGGGWRNRQRDFSHGRPKSLAYYRSQLTKKSAGRFTDSDNPTMPHSPEEFGRHFEGDIVLSLDQAEQVYDTVAHEGDRRHKRKFIASPNRRWDSNRPIEYSFDGSHTLKEQKIIELALEHWQNVTCLNFYRRNDQPRGNRIVFTDVDGCASNVGRNPVGEPQFVSLSTECLRLGVIAHEIAHSLGFWHEQSRPDRDNFVDVVWRNIDQGSLGQFLKEQPDDVDNEGISYDYGSVMHYRSKAFAKTDSLYTIMTNVRDYQRTIGQRDQLSFNDIRLMNKVYCSHKCPVQLECQRGGYTDPRRCDRCRCPDGFTGRLCEKAMGGYGSDCGGTVTIDTEWYYFNSPNYPKPFEEGQECSWLLKAPAGQHVEMEFIGQFDLYCKIEHSLCMDYVEVRNTTDFANTGMRYCCYTVPQGKIYSATEDMLVLFRSFYRSGVGFRARARAITPSSDWESWSDWGPCSTSCGGCGTRVRRRACNGNGACDGDSTEIQPCNLEPCDTCTEQRLVSTQCGLWGLFRCEKVQTVYVPCPSRCCPNYEFNGRYCERVGTNGL